MVARNLRSAAVAIGTVVLVALPAAGKGDSPRYGPELGNADLQAGHREEARRALTQAVELDSSRADIAWMLDHLDPLLSVVAIQIAAEGRYAPGQTTGLHGPYIGQTPPGAQPEAFAPGWQHDRWGRPA